MPDPTATAASTQMSLSDIATADGTFAIVAMDQRDSLRRMYEAAVSVPLSTAELVAVKADVVAALRPASAFLLDPTYGIPALAQVDGTDALPGVLVAAEPAERRSWEGEPRTWRDPDQDAAWVRRLGGHAVKFLVRMRAGRPVSAESPDLVAEALAVVAEVVADCRAQAVPCVIENLVYLLPGEQLSARERADVVVESARLLDGLGPDLLKLEYPGSPAACRRLADAVTAPWAVLSAGVGFDEFAHVLEVSCDEGGASGFIAGRAVWKEVVGMSRPDRRAFLADEGVRRLERCRSLIQGRARPWTEVIGP